jgi:hypothetical protein
VSSHVSKGAMLSLSTVNNHVSRDVMLSRKIVSAVLHLLRRSVSHARKKAAQE